MKEPLINITRTQAIWFAVFLVSYEFLTYIANDMIMPGMLHVVKTFNASDSNVARSLTAYVLGGASLQLFLGPFSDRFGRRPVMLCGALLFFVLTLCIAYSQTIHQFLFARFFEGMGLCFICVVGYAVLQEIFAETEAIRFISIMSNVAISAPLIGPIAGAIFLKYFSWRLLFVLIALLSLLVLWGLWQFMPETVGQIKRDGEQIKKTEITWLAVAGNYKKLFSNPIFLYGTLAYALLGTPCIAWIALSPVILVNEAKLSLLQYGMWQLPIFGAAILGNIILFKLTRFFSLHKLIVIGTFITLSSLVSMYVISLITHGQYIGLIPGLIFYFIGYSIIATPLNRLLLFATPVGKGTTSALISMINMGIQAIGIEVANYFYGVQGNIYYGLWSALCGLSYVGFLVIMFVHERSFKEADEGFAT